MQAWTFLKLLRLGEMALPSSLWAAPRTAAANLRALGSLLGKASAPAAPSVTSFCHLNSRCFFIPAGIQECCLFPFFGATRITFLQTRGRLKVRCLSTIGTERHDGVTERNGIGCSFVEDKSDPPTFQQAIQLLQEYWASIGCVVMQSSNTEVGAGTMNPATFLRVLGPEPWNAAYVEPSIRPDDSRFGDNPNRLQRHTQFQVILKPDPGNSQELYLGSLAALGVDTKAHDVRFVEDNWESPVLGAWGLGWEVWLDGMEITQFTYFQQAGSMPLMPISVEITYGLERILMAIQGVDHFKMIQYAPGMTYGELFLENEKEMSMYYLDNASVEKVQQRFDLYDAEAQDLLNKGLAIPAYDHLLKASHAFNVLDARGAIGVTERARYFGRMRRLARDCAQLWVEMRVRLNHPLGFWKCPSPMCHPPEAISEAAEKIVSPRHFVLEIGSEELPSQDVTSAIEQLEVTMHCFLKERRLNYGCVSILGTPRRLVVYIEDLAPTQDNIIKEVRGPPHQKAFDDKGHPTLALHGFCRKIGVTKDDVFVRADGKIDYVYATVKEHGKHAVKVLSEDLPSILGRISFHKSMRWNSQITYSRPIRWLLSLYGDMVVPFSYAEVLSGRELHSLRNSSAPIVQLRRAEDYMECITSTGIILNMQERRNVIWSKSTALAATVGGRIPKEVHGSLLNEVANLVEAPTLLLGSFDESFLELPRDVLTMVMYKHQRYFPIEDPGNGHLLPAFIVVANGKIDKGVVQKGSESVLRARYEDAKFFYESDISKPLAEFRPQLHGVLFQERLGSMLDKSLRVEKVIPQLGPLMGFDASSISTAQRAATVATADLATSLVTEFTNLAGVMGRHYALMEGQPVAVAQAIFESVLPRFAGDALPNSQAGILLAVSDRLDSLVGLFSVGCQPSATADPFGLRRCAYGLVQAIVENNRTLDMNKALHVIASVQPVPVVDSAVSEVLAFITRRLEQLLVDKGTSVEIVRAILSERGKNPMLATQSVKQLENLAKGEKLEKIIIAYSRAAKLARPEIVKPSWMVDEELFELPEEEALWSVYKKIVSQVTPGIGVDEFVEASLELIQPLDRFFSNVFVLVEDKRLQQNRLAMLQKVTELPKGIVNLSMLPGF